MSQPAGSVVEVDVRSRPLRWVSLAGALLAALQLARFAAPVHAVDDAWISFRIARNLLEHGQLTYDTTRPAVEGMTNLLWTLLSTSWIAWLPQVDPIAPARILGAVLHVATVLLAARLAGRMARRAGGSAPAAALTATLVLAASGSMAFHALSGLETALWGLLLVAALDRLDAALAGAGPRAAGLGGVWLGALALCRPEGVAIGLVACTWLAAHRESRAWVLRVVVPFVLVVTALEVFRLSVYGSLVPNTYFAKPPYPSSGLAYLSRFVLIGTGGLGLLAVVPAVRRLASARLLGSILLVTAIGTVVTGGDWMPGYRRFTEAFVCLALLAAASVGLASERARVGAAAACIIAGNAAGAVLGLDSAAYDTQTMADLGSLAHRSPEVRQVALSDIGRFGWYFPGSIYDLVGLTDRHIARLQGSHGKKTWDEAYFRDRSPDLVLVQSDRPVADLERIQFRTRTSEGPALESMLTAGGYAYRASVSLGPRTHLVVFAREGVDLPEELWGRAPEPWGSFEVEAVDGR